MSVIDRERSSIAAHRAALRGSALPPPKGTPSATFFHGFFLPFSLIVGSLRDPQIRGPYLRLVVVRGLVVMVVGGFAIANGNIAPQPPKHTGRAIVFRASKHEATDAGTKTEDEGVAGAKPKVKTNAVHVDVPGFHVDIDEEHDKAEVSVLGQPIPVNVDDRAPGPTVAAPAPEPPRGLARRAWVRLRESWAWLITLLAFLSVVEGVIVFFSRRWDDWLSFYTSRLAQIRPEDEVPKTPKLAFDLKWLYRKLKRRIRGYIVFAAGLPALLPLRLLPTVGPWAFTIAATLWGWYWLGVFSAAKSAHAWADEATAPSPLLIRTLSERVSQGRLVSPLRFYARLWARLTSGVNPAAATFERAPAAFLGLALARALLSLPGLYLLARPIVPVAAGRLCAEVDPGDRFSAGAATDAPPPVAVGGR